MSVLSKLLCLDYSLRFNCMELGHTWTPSCTEAALDIGSSCFRESLKLYLPIFLVSADTLGSRSLRPFHRPNSLTPPVSILSVTPNPQPTIRSQIIQTDSQQCRAFVGFPLIERLFGNVLFLSVQAPNRQILLFGRLLAAVVLGLVSGHPDRTRESTRSISLVSANRVRIVQPLS